MKIIFLTHNYVPTICGIGDYTYHLANEMVKRGAEVSIICFSDQNPVEENNIKVYPKIKKWNYTGVQETLKLIKSIQPDWLMVQYVPHGFQRKGLPFASVLFYRALSKINVSVLTFFHEVKIRPEHALKTKILSYIQTQIADRISKRSLRIVTSIDYYKNYLAKSAKTISVIPIGTNILPIELTNDAKNNLKEKYQINGDTKVICTFGNRDVSNYLKAFDELSIEHPNFIWLICGKNSTPLETLKSKSYIRYAGKMSSEDVYKHLLLGDVFFMPDDINSDGQGGTSNKSTALACALSLGIPVVGTKGDMNNDLLKDGDNILLPDIRNKEDLFGALKSCFDSPEFASKLGKNARHLYENNLRWEVISDQYLAIM